MSRSIRQRGIVMPLLAVALLAILAMAALALDMGDSLHEKSRLQNALDASALAGAKVLDQTGDTVQAESAARGEFSTNAAADPRMASNLSAGTLSVGVEFSNTLDPFVSGSTPARFIRVSGSGLTLDSWFAGVVGMAKRHVGGSAVAGPSPQLQTACNIVPMMACADPSATVTEDSFYGYTLDQTVTLKSDAPNDTSPAIGSGNFQLLRLDGSSGANDVRNALAGDYSNCMSVGDDTEVDTEPGNEVGPVAQGLNTRFGIYQGPFSEADRSTYRPDLITTQPDYYHSQYAADYAAGRFTNPDDGEAERRILTVPIGACSGDASGQTTVHVLGFGCFYLLEPASHQGNSAEVVGQFEGECNAQGMPGPSPGVGFGPKRIQLYKDPDHEDS